MANNESAETDPELAQMLKSADEDIRTIITVFQMFESLTLIEDSFDLKKHKRYFRFFLKKDPHWASRDEMYGA